MHANSICEFQSVENQNLPKNTMFFLFYMSYCGCIFSAIGYCSININGKFIRVTNARESQWWFSELFCTCYYISRISRGASGILSSKMVIRYLWVFLKIFLIWNGKECFLRYVYFMLIHMLISSGICTINSVKNPLQFIFIVIKFNNRWFNFFRRLS